MNKLKWKLGHLKHQCTHTKAKGIFIIYNKNMVTIKDLKITQNGQLLSFKVKINNDWINFTSVYTPPEEDNPEFFLNANEEHDTMEGDYGLLYGDFNTTLDPKHDRFGYTTDNHKKCRTTINTWLEITELDDVVRCFHPDAPLYSWRTKDLGEKG